MCHPLKADPANFASGIKLAPLSAEALDPVPDCAEAITPRKRHMEKEHMATAAH